MGHIKFVIIRINKHITLSLIVMTLLVTVIFKVKCFGHTVIFKVKWFWQLVFRFMNGPSWFFSLIYGVTYLISPFTTHKSFASSMGLHTSHKNRPYCFGGFCLDKLSDRNCLIYVQFKHYHLWLTTIIGYHSHISL